MHECLSGEDSAVKTHTAQNIEAMKIAGTAIIIFGEPQVDSYISTADDRSKENSSSTAMPSKTTKVTDSTMETTPTTTKITASETTTTKPKPERL